MKERELMAELAQVGALAGGFDRSAARLAALIRRFGGYRWVGIYDVGADHIGVVGWDGPGPPTHPRFPRTQGLCGIAVATSKAVVVGDVATHPRYLTTHPTTRSEVVVPIIRDGVVVGLIDVESERPQAFTEQDKELLDRCASVIALLWPGHPGSDA